MRRAVSPNSTQKKDDGKETAANPRAVAIIYPFRHDDAVRSSLARRSVMSGRSACLLLLALSSHATALTMGLRQTRWSGRTAVVCREADATLLDPATGKTLKCLIAGTVVVEIPGAEDEVYGALYPADTPITLAQMEDDVLVPLMEADERALFSMAQRACKDMDIELLDTAVLLTAGSGLDELLMNADEMTDADDDEDDEDAEEAMVLTAFQHEVRPAAPRCPLLPLPLPRLHDGSDSVAVLSSHGGLHVTAVG